MDVAHGLVGDGQVWRARRVRLGGLSASSERAALAAGFLDLARAEAVLQEHCRYMDLQL
jgi:hypothetical protein